MRAARIVLLFFLVLFTSAGVAALVNPLPRPPAPGTSTATSTDKSRSTTELPEGSAGTEEPSVRPGPSGVLQIELEVPEGAAETEPKPSRLEAERRVIVTVSSPEPGEITLEGLGRIEPVDARTPAIFDLLPDRAGEFEVRFDPAGEGSSRQVGMLVVTD